MNTEPVKYLETKRHVLNRGTPPDSFLDELVVWAKKADSAVFLPNDVRLDVFGVIRPTLGPWRLTDGEPFPAFFHRRAALCEVMRVHAGFESSWNWEEGVDKTNHTSQQNIKGQETGIFQVSYDSIYLGGETKAMLAYLKKQLASAIGNPRIFINAMKENHWLALDYYAHLVRVNTRWAGPLLRGEILPELSHNAVDEFIRLLA